MEFEPGHLYHIFNRGNNSQKVFFTHDNYLHFLKKIKKHLLPHADILAWCLMPNHFHLMVHVNNVNVCFTKGFTGSFTEQVTDVEGFTEQVTVVEKCGAVLKLSGSSENSHLLSKTSFSKTRSLNDSVGIVLRSYARAIQKQEGYTGSLFQNRTKAICLTLPGDLSPTWFQTSFGTVINVDLSEANYSQVCFNYIHSNPVSAGLVKLPEQWEFSSARDYAGIRNGKLINRNRSSEFGLQYN